MHNLKSVQFLAVQKPSFKIRETVVSGHTQFLSVNYSVCTSPAISFSDAQRYLSSHVIYYSSSEVNLNNHTVLHVSAHLCV